MSTVNPAIATEEAGRRRFDAGDVDAVRRYAADLMNWFAIHATTEDRELASFLRGEAA